MRPISSIDPLIRAEQYANTMRQDSRRSNQDKRRQINYQQVRRQNQAANSGRMPTTNHQDQNALFLRVRENPKFLRETLMSMNIEHNIATED